MGGSCQREGELGESNPARANWVFEQPLANHGRDFLVKAALFDGTGEPIRIESVDDPKAGPDDVVIKVHRCGICGSDVSMTGNSAFTFAPGPLGHEYAGEIVEVGRNVKSDRPGDRVSCVPSPPCGQGTGVMPTPTLTPAIATCSPRR